jgi:hypothetical protein
MVTTPSVLPVIQPSQGPAESLEGFLFFVRVPKPLPEKTF